MRVSQHGASLFPQRLQRPLLHFNLMRQVVQILPAVTPARKVRQVLPLLAVLLAAVPSSIGTGVQVHAKLHALNQVPLCPATKTAATVAADHAPTPNILIHVNQALGKGGQMRAVVVLGLGLVVLGLLEHLQQGLLRLGD